MVVGLPDVGGLVGGVLQLDQHQRQAVDKQHDVGPAGMVRPLDRELVDRPAFVAAGVCPIGQAHKIAHGFAVALVLHRHARHQQFVECTVGR